MPAWPKDVEAAIEKETQLRQQVASLLSPVGIHLDKEDSALWEKLEAARNKEFRELRFKDYVRDVDAMVGIVDKYQKPAAK